MMPLLAVVNLRCSRAEKASASILARPQATAAVRRHPIRGALRRNKMPSSAAARPRSRARIAAGYFVTPTQPPWAASFGYQKPVSTEPIGNTAQFGKSDLRANFSCWRGAVLQQYSMYCKKSQRSQRVKFPQSTAAAIVRCCLYRGLLKPPISVYFSIFAISSATNWTLVPMIT